MGNNKADNILRQEIKNKNKYELRNAAIESIMKYGLTAPKLNETLGKAETIYIKMYE